MKDFEIKNQNGRSMIEMLGVLAIIGVLSVGGIAGYSKAMTKYRINKTIEQITLIAGNIRSFFAPQGNYAGSNSDVNTGKAIIKKAKLVPDEMWDGNDIKDVWDGLVKVRAYNNSTDFSISIQGVPQEACIELVTQDWSATSPHAIVIGGSYTSEIFSYGYSAVSHNSCKSGKPDVSGGPFSDGHGGINSGAIPYVFCDATVSVDAAISACSENGTVAFAFH